MIGRVVPKKAHRDAIAALVRLRERGVETTLTVVGDGAERAALEAEAAASGVGDRVVFAPSTDQAGLLEHLGSADVFVHCSVTAGDGDVEGIPNVVVEAAATGLPVVGTRHGGIPEVVEDGVTGLLVPESDPAALAAALASLATSPTTREALGRAGAQRMRRDFDLGEQVARYGVLYRELLASGSVRKVPLPSDWAERVRRGADVRPRAYDATLVRAASASLEGAGVDAAAAGAARSFDRVLEATTAWPRPWRSAAELTLDLLRASPVGGPLRAFRERSTARAAAFDRVVLDALASGVRLGAPAGAWPERALADLAGEVPPTSGWRRWRARLAGVAGP